MKKPSDPKALTFGAWGLKTSLGQFGHKAFGKGLFKALVENPSSNFHKQDSHAQRVTTGLWDYKIS